MAAARSRRCTAGCFLDGQEPRAGLLLGWRRTPTGWQARVVCTLGHTDRPEDDSLVVAWMPAEQLRPAR